MLLAWSTTEVVRYLYFALMLAGYEPSWLLWMRYSGFYVLYPIGISSELAELYFSILQARENGDDWYVAAAVVLVILYIPGSPILYNHMRSQRRKVLGGQKKTQ